MKYIVTRSVIETCAEDFAQDAATVTAVILCEDTKDVYEAIRGCTGTEDWAVFEVVNGKTVRRAVIFGVHTVEVV